jgi:hypothetical protein
MLSASFQPMYLNYGSPSTFPAYVTVLLMVTGVTLTSAYLIKGFMASVFVFQKLNEQTTMTLLDMFDNIPDAVILLDPKKTPSLTTITTFDAIQVRDVGVTFYDILYRN